MDFEWQGSSANRRFDGVPAGLYKTTPDGRILDANPALAVLLGYPDVEALKEANAADFYVNAEDRARWKYLMGRKGIIFDFRVRLRRADGVIRWFSDQTCAVRAEGRVVFYEGFLQDISEWYEHDRGGLEFLRQSANSGVSADRPADRPAAAQPESAASGGVQAEIDRRFGFIPEIFRPALPFPEILENLWRQTQFAYLDNPIPSLFKEKLFACLSRYCGVSYCTVWHSCALRPLGVSAGEILKFLGTHIPLLDQDVEPDIRALSKEPGPMLGWPLPHTPLGQNLFRCSVFAFISPFRAGRICAEVRRLVGDLRFAHWVSFLSYIKFSFLWAESHPEISYQADRLVMMHLSPLLAAEPRLSDYFGDHHDKIQTYA